MKYFGQKGGSDGSGGGGGGDTNPNMFICAITSYHSIFPEFNIQSLSSVNLSVVHLHLHWNSSRISVLTVAGSWLALHTIT